MDSILYWNEVALEADRVTHTTLPDREVGSRGPAGSSRALGIVHLAMHDAYFGDTGAYQPYLGTELPPVPTDYDADAAVGGAAHAALSALYPTQKAFFDTKHAAAGLISGKNDANGHAFGRKVAAAILKLRKDDPSLGDDGYASSPAMAHHRPDPDNSDQGFYAPFYGAGARCFAVTGRYVLDEPPQPGSDEYDQALRQVRSKGIAPHLIGTLPGDLLPSRTANETTTGMFWAYDGAKELGTPPRFYNQIIREVARARGNDPAQNARLFAVVNAALADAGILAWENKYIHDLWRPVLGIREHDSSLGPTAMEGTSLDSGSDPFWLPLGAPKTNVVGKKNFTPNFPAYPSGHATFGAAAFQSVRRFYNQGDYSPDTLADGLEFVSDELNGINVDNNGTIRPKHVRRFPGGLWEMIAENARSRIFLGVHWVFDAFAVNEFGEMDLSQNVGGVKLGLNIANDIADHGLQATNGAPGE